MDSKKRPSSMDTTVNFVNTVQANAPPMIDLENLSDTNVDVDFREIYFLIMHFLSAGPCQKTFGQLWDELFEHDLLPRRYHAWYSRNGTALGDENEDGNSFPLQYHNLIGRYSHVGKDHLAKLLKEFMVTTCLQQRTVVGRTALTAVDVPTLLGKGSFSLLSSDRDNVNNQVRCLPSYLRWPHMQADQVRGLHLREIGGGFSKHHRAPSIRFACYAIAKPSTMVQKMQNIKKLRGHRDAVYCAIFDRSGRYVITGSDDRLVKIWSMETALCLASCRGHEGDITDLSVSSNNALVASASNDYNIRVWRLPDGMPISVLRGHTGAVTAIAFSPRPNTLYQLLSSSDDGTCRVWDARYSQFSPRVYLPKQAEATAGKNSSMPSASASSSTNLQGHKILCCAFNANGTVFVTGSSDTFARVWSACKPNLDDPEKPIHEIDKLAGHENDVNYVQFSGCAVASRSSSSDSFTEDNIPKFKNSWFSHNNIVTCSRDGSAIIWIPRSQRYHGKVGRWIRAYHLKVPLPPMDLQPRRGGPHQRYLPTPRGVNMIVWSLDNRFVLAAIMDNRICVWNANDGSLVHSLAGHTASTYVLDVHPFNPRIAMSAGYDGKTIVWDIWEGTPIRVYEIGGRFKLVDGKFSQDGTSIVLSDDVGQIYLLNTGQGESQKDAKYDQFFLGDYRPLTPDTHGNVVDQETQLLPYHRNIQDPLCDSSMLPYPEPYQSMYQKRRLGALGIEWRPSSIKFAIGTDLGSGQEFHILPLADLDVPLEPMPDFMDTVFWEPENEGINDDNDSEYNVTEDYLSDEQDCPKYDTSSDSNCSEEEDDNKTRRNPKTNLLRSKRKKSVPEDFTTSSGERFNQRISHEHDGTSSRSKRYKKSRISRQRIYRKKSPKPKSTRPQRVASRNRIHISSDESTDEYVSSDNQSSLEIRKKEHNDDQKYSSVAKISEEIGVESKKKLVLKFSLRDTSTARNYEENPLENGLNLGSEDKGLSLANEVDKELFGKYCESQPTDEKLKETDSSSSWRKLKICTSNREPLSSEDVNVAGTSGSYDLIPDTKQSCDPQKCSKKKLIILNLKPKNIPGVALFKTPCSVEQIEKNHDPQIHDETYETVETESYDLDRRSRSFSSKAPLREINLENHDYLQPGTSQKSSKRALDELSVGKNKNYMTKKLNWLMLTEKEEGYRYIPQLGDEVVYLRQGHQEYIEHYSLAASSPVPWLKYGDQIRAVEICSVDDLKYTTHSSGDSSCQLTLKFIDNSSHIFGQKFRLTLPELENFPDFIVESTRYFAALNRNWTVGDKCNVWWRDNEGGGAWWDGQIVGMKDKNCGFPGSPWERLDVRYAVDDTDSRLHSPWELHDPGSSWEQPVVEFRVREEIVNSLNRWMRKGNKDKDRYGILKLNEVAQKLDFMNRFPVPLSPEIIKLRLENNYYRSLKATKHDVEVMLSNAESYFQRNTEILRKMKRLSSWFGRILSDV